MTKRDSLEVVRSFDGVELHRFFNMGEKAVEAPCFGEVLLGQNLKDDKVAKRRLHNREEIKFSRVGQTMPQVKKPDDLQVFANHPVFCIHDDRLP